MVLLGVVISSQISAWVSALTKVTSTSNVFSLAAQGPCQCRFFLAISPCRWQAVRQTSLSFSAPLTDGDHNFIFMEQQYRVVVVHVANIFINTCYRLLYRIVPVLCKPVQQFHPTFLHMYVQLCTFLIFLGKKLIILPRSGQQSNYGT